MFVFLTKKVAIPHGVKLRVVAWNHDQGWIACGADTGLLKVLRLDGSGSKAGSNLSMNQTLEGHSSAVCGLAWNNQFRKLTSSDEKGLIIVWSLHKGMWFEEMVNNRNQSVVRDLSWSSEGKCVCIVYEDGAVIVGGVDGNRLWGKELKKNLARVTWSPDGKYLLFGLANGEVDVHDANFGAFVKKVPIVCVETGNDGPKLTGLEWSKNLPVDKHDTTAFLAVCYDNGKAQLMRNEVDESPYLIDTGLKVSSIEWNPQGTMIAFAGLPLMPTQSDKPIVSVQFYSHTGDHLRTLRVPGSECGGVSWEGNGLRVSLAVDSFIFFANVRPNYQAAYFNQTCVYTYPRRDRNDTAVMYWNVKTHERTVKSVRHLSHITACGDVCALVLRSEDMLQHQVQLTNAIGAPVSVSYIDVDPVVVSINETSVVVCGRESVFFWQFQVGAIDVLDPVSIQHLRKESQKYTFHVDDIMLPDSPTTSLTKKNTTQDHICATELSSKYLFIGRESGVVQMYTISPLVSVAKYQFGSRPQHIKCNCDSTMLAYVDVNGVFSMMAIDEATFSPISRPAQLLPGFERKDVWHMMWASDNSEMFLTMEKLRMYIFRGTDPEEPVQSSSIPMQFENLEVRTVMLDDIMSEPDRPAKEAVVDFETKSLRDTRELLRTVSAKEGILYVEDHPHPKLWSLVAESALENLDFAIAEKAVVQCKDYAAIQFVKRIQTLDEPGKQKAEIHAYYHRFDEAEKTYKDMDRKDLALELRARLGDWFRVVQLVQEGGGDESLMLKAWENIGDYYADRQKWSKAVQYYTQCKHYEKLSNVYYAQEDFKALEKLIDQASHDKNLLVEMGKKFLSVGLAESAVNAYLRADEVRKAVDCCVELNQWGKAVALAEKHHLADISQYLSKYANHLVDKGQLPQAIELYRKAGQHGDAAKLISQLAQKVAARNEHLKAKKYHVLAALEIESFRRKQSTLEDKSAKQMVDDLLLADQVTGTDRSLDSAWRGAEAFHFLLISQQHLLQGNLDLALLTAMRLMEYDEYVDPLEAYSVIALAAFYNKNFGICSKAFTRLEALESNPSADSNEALPTRTSAPTALALADIDLTKATSAAASMELLSGSDGSTTTALYPTINLNETAQKFGSLAVKIFTKHPPSDTSLDRVKCPKCAMFNKEWASSCLKCQQPFQKCIVTGRAIVEATGFWQCQTCHHRCFEEDVRKYKHCPLCHSPRHKAFGAQ